MPNFKALLFVTFFAMISNAGPSFGGNVFGDCVVNNAKERLRKDEEKIAMTELFEKWDRCSEEVKEKFKTFRFENGAMGGFVDHVAKPFYHYKDGSRIGYRFCFAYHWSGGSIDGYVYLPFDGSGAGDDVSCRMPGEKNRD